MTITHLYSAKPVQLWPGYTPLATEITSVSVTPELPQRGRAWKSWGGRVSGGGVGEHHALGQGQAWWLQEAQGGGHGDSGRG